ncbi:MAG: NUDIX domain-containing protein [Pseudotabrizicola sp.]|uniref:NUDIX domain-containing protein n=1 Tax=Pseudotabrizicola sp. TaxID=2939647 RepID=UPI0027320372|nr:NUDIX domain-containing protein [Pseudotabrizicola sp.]MDP2082859.1 NUDIX domain-containing protein [Pseudotabrizicola sp.]MDZ7574391.1 NUDIX domain-containing protein [Pseudotabrizicola sp.]
MAALFLAGPLRHAPLLAVILGKAATLSPATAAGRSGQLVDAPGHFGLLRKASCRVEGSALRDATPEDMARLAFYAKAIGLGRYKLSLIDAAGGGQAETFALRPPFAKGQVWDEAVWLADHAALAVETAVEVMALYGQTPPACLSARIGPMMVRAASRLRAQADQAPAAVRRGPGQVTVQSRRQPYANFFAVEEYDLSFRRFDGAMSPVITRAAFVSADAVTVLPYDPQRDRVLLVEQMRAGPFSRGDANPWQLEAIAGRIDPGETPEDCARREAVEEAGLSLGALLPVAAYYPSPGAKTEFIYSYAALTDLPDGVAGVFGVEGEAEDIRGHLLGFDQAMALVGSGEVQNAPLLLTLLWLQRERTRLRS